MRSSLLVGVVVAAVVAVAGVKAGRSAEKAPAKVPVVEGGWTGTWGPYVAPKPEPAEGQSGEGEKKKFNYTRLQKQLDCQVKLLPNGDYEATFEGECGRPYKYTIKMLGRASTGAVLFKGSADLGPMDGGVYDWIGRATDKEFLGFYTSGSHTGTFTLARPAPAAAAK